MLSIQYDPDDDCPYPQCPNRGRLTSHYHCAHCDDPNPTSYLGHYLGGMRPDAQVICDAAKRRQYVVDHL